MMVKGKETLLKKGDQVLCVTQYNVDKAEVIEIDTKAKVATLSNQVKIASTVYNNGALIRVGNTPANATYKLWSDEVEAEYQYWLAKKGMKVAVGCISSAVDTMPKADLVAVYKKLRKIIDKYNLVIS